MNDDQKQTASQDVFLMSDMPNTELPDTQLTDAAGASQLFMEEPESAQVPVKIDESSYLKAHEERSSANDVWVPLLGKRTAKMHRNILLILFVVFFVATAGLAGYTIYQGYFLRNQLTAANTIQINSTQATQGLDAAVIGNVGAFDIATQSYGKLKGALGALSGTTGSASGNLASSLVSADVQAINGLLNEELDQDIQSIDAQKDMLVSLTNSIAQTAGEVAFAQEQIDALKLRLVQRGAPAAQSVALGDLSMLVERIDKLSREVMTPGGISPEGAYTLGKDVAISKTLLLALSSGNVDFEITPLNVEEVVALEDLTKTLAKIGSAAGQILESIPDVVNTRRAHNRIMESFRAATPSINSLIETLNGTNAAPLWQYGLLGIFGVFALISAAGLAYVQLADTKRLQTNAEEENRKNQGAILRLMDELQNLQDGDLTQEATVSEDITGSVADSVNSTVEVWRDLVGNVQTTADRVVQTTADVELTSSTLFEASTEQLNEIRNTGTSVLDMASRIHDVSGQAQESALVAQRSREAAEQGYKAVQTSIESMNVLRGQIQDTSKRIKRLGESSQEIGEITELISDITEQTNVLALNAAIQAASAGEAGRGFSVVAEEVQRLAERSGEATKQISALVKAIQTDTHDAVAAMERSTQGVVQGAKLSDNAGQALGQIDMVSRQLAELIQKISVTTEQQAQQANMVANNIQDIFAVTEQTTEGTRTTAQEVRELAKVAQELLDSVARFKIK